MKKMVQAMQASIKLLFHQFGKTGTAEVYQNGQPRVNSTYIGYAPVKDPKLAFSIVYTNQPVPPPWLNGGDLGRDIINYYFKNEK